MTRAHFYMNFNKVCLEINNHLKLKDLIEEEQLNYVIYELGLPSDCIFNHINVNYYEMYNCSVLSGDLSCEDCKNIDNVVFDHLTYTFHSMPLVHTVYSSTTQISTPMLILNLIYISEKWIIVSYGGILNNLLFYNGNTFEEIFKRSWGFNKISILPKNQGHIFAKSLKSIIENTNDGFDYIMSYYKQDQFCFINNKLKTLFPSKVCMQMKFLYAAINTLEEKEPWIVVNNFKRRTSKKQLKRLSVISYLTEPMIKTFSVLISSGNLRDAVNYNFPLTNLINPNLISYQKL